ncbi:MAG: tetratricopeptide repeat protein, partial [Armatimonadota bacterium]|nr:tetratricopeptide repeat protein [Armatimonadota bacterium]
MTHRTPSPATGFRHGGRGALLFCVLWAFSWLYQPVWAQPPAQTATQQAQEQAAIEAAWKSLRQQNERLEISDPQQAIVSYKSFYEERGYRSLEVAIDLSSRIAQLYWRELGNRVKAREIYDWAVGQYGTLKGGERLIQERALLTGEKVLSVGPVQTRPGAAVAPVRAGVAIMPGPSGTRPANSAGLAAPVPGATGLAIAPPVVLRLPKVPMPIDLGGARLIAPGVTPLRGGAAALALSQLEAGAMTPEAAWQSGALTMDDVVAALEQRRLFEEEEPAQVRLREGLLALLVRHGQERWLPQPTAATPRAKPVSGRVQLAVADYLSKADDERAVAVYEELLRETERTKNQGPPVRVVGAVNHLASHYERRGQLQKAIEVYMNGAKYSDSPHWQASLRLHAARLYRQIGEKEKAHELYTQVPQYGAGWITGLAIFDQASELLHQGQHAEARKLLLQPVTGAGAEPVQVALLARLGDSFYHTGEFDQARHYYQKAIERFQSLSPAQRGNGLEATLNMVQRTLRRVEQWTKEPIIVEPRELRLQVRPQQKTPTIGRLSVHTFQDVPLTVTTANPLIKARVLESSGWGDEAIKSGADGMIKEVIVEIASEALQRSLQVTLNVSSPKFPDFKVQVLVH